jgi:acyl carrier protein
MVSASGADEASGDLAFAGVVAAIRKTLKGPAPPRIELHHSFVQDLGFDSMSIALLGLALEDQFGRAILLDGWIAQHSHPASLTVQSLCAYVDSALSDDG